MNAPRLPLSVYEEAAFKLFGVDVGVVGAMAGLDVRAVIEGNRLFTEFKGALTEQFVAQQLVATTGGVPHYWASGPGGAEVDFLAQCGSDVVPIEAKAERNLQAKSLRVFREKYDPVVAVRTSLMPYAARPGLIDLPLYGIGQLPEVVRAGCA